MPDLGDTDLELDEGMATLALEAATLLNTLKEGSTVAEITTHADRIDAALCGIEAPLLRSWMGATAKSLRHAVLYAAARPDLDTAEVAVMEARTSRMARSHVAILGAIGSGAR